MVVTGFSYDTYDNWSLYPPLIVAIVWLVLHTVIGTVLLYFHIASKRNFKSLSPYILRYLKIVFRGSLKEENDQIKFYGYEIYPLNVIVLSLVTTITLCCVFISFWAAFLLEETFVCDPRLDCFVTNSSLSSASAKDFQTIKDCGEIEENATVRCFQFEFDAAEGFSYAVGFFGVAVAFITLYNNLLIWFMGKVSSSNIKKSATSWFWKICWIITLFAPTFFIFLILILIFSVPLFRDSVLNTRAEALKLVAYMVFVIDGGQVTAIFLSITVCKQHKDRNDEDQNPAQETENEVL